MIDITRSHLPFVNGLWWDFLEQSHLIYLGYHLTMSCPISALCSRRAISLMLVAQAALFFCFKCFEMHFSFILVNDRYYPFSFAVREQSLMRFSGTISSSSSRLSSHCVSPRLSPLLSKGNLAHAFFRPRCIFVSNVLKCTSHSFSLMTNITHSHLPFMNSLWWDFQEQSRLVYLG